MLGKLVHKLFPVKSDSETSDALELVQGAGGEVQPTPAHLADGQPLAGDQRCDDECSLVAHTTG